MAATVLTYDDIDDVLADTFPASDPPAWTPGIARPAPAMANETLVLSHPTVPAVRTYGRREPWASSNQGAGAGHDQRLYGR